MAFPSCGFFGAVVGGLEIKDNEMTKVRATVPYCRHVATVPNCSQGPCPQLLCSQYVSTTLIYGDKRGGYLDKADILFFYSPACPPPTPPPRFWLFSS